MTSLYQRVLGHPFVYHHVRPLVVGIDYTYQYHALAVSADDVIVDIGCGGGDALRYLDRFAGYHGYDTDGVAIGFAKERPEAQRPEVTFTQGYADAQVLADRQPTRIMMNGLLHHLDDADAVDVLAMCGACPSVERVVTNDVIYLADARANNLMASLDRGKFVRDMAGYRALVTSAGLRAHSLDLVRSHPDRGFVRYLVMVLTPVRDQDQSSQ